MSVSEVTTAPTWRERIRHVPWQQLTPLLGLALLIIVGSLVHPAFLSPTNLFNVLTRSAPVTPTLDATVEGGQYGYARVLATGGFSKGVNGVRADLNITRWGGWRNVPRPPPPN